MWITQTTKSSAWIACMPPLPHSVNVITLYPYTPHCIHTLRYAGSSIASSERPETMFCALCCRLRNHCSAPLPPVPDSSGLFAAEVSA